METLEQHLMAGPVPSDSVRQGLTAVITEQDGLNQVTASPGGVCVCKDWVKPVKLYIPDIDADGQAIQTGHHNMPEVGDMLMEIDGYTPAGLR